MWVRGRENVRKQLLVHAAGCNLRLLLRHLTGIGTQGSLQGRTLAALSALSARWLGHWDRLTRVWTPDGHCWRSSPQLFTANRIEAAC